METAAALKGWGLALFIVGLCAVLGLWAFQPSCGDLARYEDIDELRSQTECLQSQASWLRWSQPLNWLAEKVLAGGFLMWLAGVLIANVRPREGDAG